LITLGIDTTEARGSVAVWRDGALASLQQHETAEDYSSWLLPAVEKCLRQAEADRNSVAVFGVATGPGSFTGLRVGITAVKAWAELWSKPVVGVSRLEVMARTSKAQDGFVAATFNAQRGQIFGGLYSAGGSTGFTLVAQEMVTGADEFVRWVAGQAAESRVHWVALDPELVRQTSAWQERAERGEVLSVCGVGLAAGVAQLAEERAQRGESSSALRLDANYVRRSDAEIFWKDPASDGR
jgi:tRNA threonylcarbamoyladenosine biosynthesis protein TsaB